MNTNVKTVCGVLTTNSDFKICTVSMLIYNWGCQLSYKTINSNEIVSLFHYVHFPYCHAYLTLPIQQPQASAYLHKAKIKTS